MELCGSDSLEINFSIIRRRNEVLIKLRQSSGLPPRLLREGQLGRGMI